jgi:uncharacterized membrane protein
LAIVAGTVLRFAGIGRLSIWFDEGYTAWLVSHSPGEILRLVRADTAPPLYYLLLRYWIDLFGTSAAALRSLSAVLSVLALIVAVDVARQLLPRPPALAAAAWALALSFFAVWYAQEARAYSLMALRWTACCTTCARATDAGLFRCRSFLPPHFTRTTFLLHTRRRWRRFGCCLARILCGGAWPIWRPRPY